MKTLFALVAAMLALAASPAAAQPRAMDPKPLTEAMLAQIDALPLDRMCHKSGAYQYRFGSTEFPRNPFVMIDWDKHAMAPANAPFVEYWIGSTKWSNQFFTINYEFYLENKEQALIAIERLAKRFRSLNWTERPGGVEEDGTFYDYPPGEGEFAFYSEATQATGDHRTGVRAAFTHLGGWVTFECASLPLTIVQLGEAFGNLPEGTPRPVAPTTERPDMLDIAQCETPEGRKRVSDAFGATPDTLLRYLLERASYRERLVTWKSDRLKKAGVAGERLLQLSMAGFSGNPMSGFGAFLDILPQYGKLADARKAGDVSGACRITIEILRAMAAASVTTDRQWDTIEAALDAEAKRVGVTFD